MQLRPVELAHVTVFVFDIPIVMATTRCSTLLYILRTSLASKRHYFAVVHLAGEFLPYVLANECAATVAVLGNGFAGLCESGNLTNESGDLW